MKFQKTLIFVSGIVLIVAVDAIASSFGSGLSTSVATVALGAIAGFSNSTGDDQK